MREGLNAKGREELATLLLQIGFKEEAVAELLTTAAIYEKNEEKEKAISTYHRILETDPRNSVALRKLEELAPESLATRPSSDEIVTKLGLEELPSDSEILVEFEKYKGELKEDPEKRIELASSFLEAGMIEEAKKNAEVALRIEKTPKVTSLLAQIYLKEGKRDKARELLKEGLELPYPEEDKRELHYQLGIIYHNLDNIPLALAELDKVPKGYKDTDALREEWERELPEEEKIPEVVPEKFPVIEEAPPAESKPEEEIKELGEENISFL